MGVGQGRPWVRKYGVQDSGWVGGRRGWNLCVGGGEGWCKGRTEVSIGRFGGFGRGGTSRCQNHGRDQEFRWGSARVRTQTKSPSLGSAVPGG